jgi:hypothetical protein
VERGQISCFWTVLSRSNPGYIHKFTMLWNQLV